MPPRLTISGRLSDKLLRAREAQFLIETEWAQTPQDILERRTKHGLHMTSGEREAFEVWFDQQSLAA